MNDSNSMAPISLPLPLSRASRAPSNSSKSSATQISRIASYTTVGDSSCVTALDQADVAHEEEEEEEEEVGVGIGEHVDRSQLGPSRSPIRDGVQSPPTPARNPNSRCVLNYQLTFFPIHPSICLPLCLSTCPPICQTLSRPPARKKYPSAATPPSNLDIRNARRARAGRLQPSSPTRVHPWLPRSQRSRSLQTSTLSNPSQPLTSLVTGARSSRQRPSGVPPRPGPPLRRVANLQPLRARPIPVDVTGQIPRYLTGPMRLLLRRLPAAPAALSNRAFPPLP
jgi:hypothetical protein